MLYYEMTGFMPGHRPDGDDDAIALPDPSDSALLLDFDGTLVEIADRPMGVVVPARVPDLLSRAMDRMDGRVALVSGRTIDDLETFLPGFDGNLIGTHGAEARIDGTKSQTQDIDLATVSRLQRLVDDFAALRPEFLVENKPSGVVLHYRQAEEQAGLAMKFMDSLACASDGFRLQPALMAYELKPEGVGKDVGVRTLMGLPGFAGKTPIYAGDDLTDEAAMDVAQGLGGIGIKIGEAETVGRFRLAGPDALVDVLEKWLA
ncbi:trehalose-phosphatase [Jannaschia sp. LMIT008]|uniref:trehalose-phosphatase n=1 Tax=Jannaschia maritima TaxID=3032585 RepID=UPI002811FAC2|nr:trehalose-phosphatase [Jannaschia sp. LMIT008]